MPARGTAFYEARKPECYSTNCRQVKTISVMGNATRKDPVDSLSSASGIEYSCQKRNDLRRTHYWRRDTPAWCTGSCLNKLRTGERRSRRETRLAMVRHAEPRPCVKTFVELGFRQIWLAARPSELGRALLDQGCIELVRREWRSGGKSARMTLSRRPMTAPNQRRPQEKLALCVLSRSRCLATCGGTNEQGVAASPHPCALRE